MKARLAMNRSKSILLMLLLLGGAAGSQARVRRIEITRIESPTFEGMSFGRVGQYEKLVGRVFGEVNPNDPFDSQITDIALAPRDSSGLVEYSADIVRTRYEDPPQTVPGEPDGHQAATERNTV